MADIGAITYDKWQLIVRAFVSVVRTTGRTEPKTVSDVQCFARAKRLRQELYFIFQPFNEGHHVHYCRPSCPYAIINFTERMNGFAVTSYACTPTQNKDLHLWYSLYWTSTPDINEKKCIHHPPGVRKSCLCIVRRPATWRAFTRDQFTTTRIYANPILELRLMARLSYDDCTMYIQSLAIACHLFASTLIAARFLNMFKNLFSDARSLAITCDHPENRTRSRTFNLRTLAITCDHLS